MDNSSEYRITWNSNIQDQIYDQISAALSAIPEEKTVVFCKDCVIFRGGWTFESLKIDPANKTVRPIDE